ncbi:hypothetical protein CCACVL1_05021 [Corchorus capsularis]|uniref:Uncharacterized protein n=1 Tax=Corchorus capsularis TaxID=210143 RepID=A0A1R3JN98_COCAP|nr:hypothetical protein CCACVL1_05021 [Corchorus capsularis]
MAMRTSHCTTFQTKPYPPMELKTKVTNIIVTHYHKYMLISSQYLGDGFDAFRYCIVDDEIRFQE